MSTPKDSSRKTTKKEKISPTPPEKKRSMLKRAKALLPSSGLAKQKKKLRAPKKKPSGAAKLVFAAAIALGGTAAPLDASAKVLRYSTAPPLTPIYDVMSPEPASSVESIRYLLHLMKAETDKYMKSPLHNVFEVPLGDGAKLRLRMNVNKTLSFMISKPGNTTRFFEINFSDLDILTPEVRIVTTEDILVVSLLDKMNGRHARFSFLKSDITPKKMITRIFDESADLFAAQYIFQALNNFPELGLDSNTIESKLLSEAFQKMESILIHRIQQIEFSASSPEDKRKARERTVDIFMDLYASIGGDVIDVISFGMKGMDREQRKRVVDLAIPRLTALVLRPFAAWQGSLAKLDKCTSSPDFSIQTLREFAWHNNLHQEYTKIFKDVRKKLSK